MYEVFEHTADLGIRIRADDLNALFVEAGHALFSVITQDTSAIRPIETVEFQIEAQEMDYLLVDWLNELLFAFESRGLLLTDFSVKIDGEHLQARAQGEPVDDARHRLEHEVKAITYHGLQVIRSDQGWLAEVILDI
jgi:SHS2 domain-containing protein